MLTEVLHADLSDADWVERVSTALLRLDPSLDGPQMYGLAIGLCARPRWRALRPEDAAHKAIEEPEAVDGV